MNLKHDKVFKSKVAGPLGENAGGETAKESAFWANGRLWSESKSQKQWVDYVREDLQSAGLSYTWWRKSQDRAGWRTAIECLLQCT